jgi:hypothetical protein
MFRGGLITGGTSVWLDGGLGGTGWLEGVRDGKRVDM